jgi:ribosomal protein S6
MITMKLQRKYEIMILLTEEFNDNELRTWVSSYMKNLTKFSACNISFRLRGKQNLSYRIKKKKKGHFVQFNFSSVPNYLESFLNILASDSRVLRFSLFNES